MIIIPAIDILGGKCVRLYKGNYESAKVVASDAVETIKRFISDSSKYIHIVDLDGAKSGTKENHKLIQELSDISSVPLEVGGGIRDIETVKFYLDCGIERIILGSAAIKDPEFLNRALKLYEEKIAVGIDAKNGFVSVSGWTENSYINYLDFAKKMEAVGVKNIIFTDIGRDGTLDGPNLDMLFKLSKTVSINITASGGIKDIKDIENLKKLKLYGAICGRSVYDGTLNLREAIALCEEEA